MCDRDTGAPYHGFYKALSALPPLDGLRLATIESLVSLGSSGGDILRMTNNVLRLGSWEEEEEKSFRETDGTTSPKKRKLILTKRMDEDFIGEDNYHNSMVSLTEFLLGDLEFLAPDATTKEAAMAVEDFVTRVALTAMSFWRQAYSKKTNHFTRGRLKNPEQRAELEQGLADDKLLGPILSGFRAIIDSAGHRKA